MERIVAYVAAAIFAFLYLFYIEPLSLYLLFNGSRGSSLTLFATSISIGSYLFYNAIIREK